MECFLGIIKNNAVVAQWQSIPLKRDWSGVRFTPAAQVAESKLGTYNDSMKKISNQPKKKTDSVAVELRGLGVAMEHMDGKISLVAEQYGSIQENIGGIKKTLNTHTEMIGKLAMDMEIVKEDIEFIKGGFKKKVDVEEFSALERRVSLLEKRR